MKALLPLWIIGAPFVYFIFDWMRTPKTNLSSRPGMVPGPGSAVR